jgi:hypothetical protein
MAGGEGAPEGGIGLGLRVLRFDEHRVMAADDLLQPIADDVEEVGIGGDDLAVRLELDHGQRPVERLEDR